MIVKRAGMERNYYLRRHFKVYALGLPALGVASAEPWLSDMKTSGIGRCSKL